MVIVDADTRKVIATPGVGAGADASLFDPDTGNGFASGWFSNPYRIHEDSTDQFRVADYVPTQSGARTLALDPKTHNVLLVAERHGQGATHSQVLPNTCVVLVGGK